MSLKAGKLRHVVAFQEKRTVVTPTGERQEVWETVWPSVYAAVEPLSARDLFSAGAEQAEVVGRLTIRYRPGVHHGMRVLHRGQVYHIEGVQPDPISGIEWLTLPVSLGLRDAPPLGGV